VNPYQKIDAVYARYSSHNQDGGVSIEVQLDHTHRAAGVRCEDYIDRARSGRAIGGRPEFKRLIADIEAGKVGRLWVYSYDRLGRASFLIPLAERLSKCGCEIISVTEGRDELVRDIQLILGKDAIKKLAKKTRDGLVQRFNENTSTGGELRYGYHWLAGTDGRKRPAQKPEEIAHVLKIIDMYLAEPVGLKLMARRLDGHGIPTRQGGPWSHTTVRSILTNRMLIGEVRFGQRQFVMDEDTGNRLPKFLDTDQHKVRRLEELRAIPDETFEAIQQQQKLRARQKGATKAVNGVRPFTGLLFCHACKSVCYARKSKNSKGEYNSYGCGCRQRKGPQACPHAGTVREDKLIHLVSSICHDILGNGDKVIAAAMKIGLQRMDSGRAEAAQLRGEVKALEDRNKRLTGLLLDPEIDSVAKRTISRQMAENEEQREKIEGRLAQVADSSSEGNDKLVRAVRVAYREARESLSKIASPTHLNRFVETYIGPMSVTEQGLVKPHRLESTTPSAGAEGVVYSHIAGACPNPVCAFLGSLFRSRWRQAA